ncbi:MAG TPA: type II secretion system protein, partial [Limnochordia bacterium]|nr:type II secretion system protein [Limnochordia bacterium]
MLKKFRKMLKKQEGFTLVELMVAVVILGILAGIGVQQYGRIQRDAKIAAHNANVRIITNAANMYIMMHDDVPSSVEALAPEFLQDPVPKPPAGLNYKDGVDSSNYTLSVTPPEENSDGTWQVVVTP